MTNLLAHLPSEPSPTVLHDSWNAPYIVEWLCGGQELKTKKANMSEIYGVIFLCIHGLKSGF